MPSVALNDSGPMMPGDRYSVLNENCLESRFFFFFFFFFFKFSCPGIFYLEIFQMDKIKVSSQLVRIAPKSSKAYGENTPYQCLGPRTLIITLQFAGEDIAAEPTISYFHRNFPIVI